MLIISTSVWNCSSPPGVRSSFSRFTATNDPSARRPLYTLPNPPLPRMFLLLKLSVATCSSRRENLLSCPKWTSGSSSAAKYKENQWSLKPQNIHLLLVWVDELRSKRREIRVAEGVVVYLEHRRKTLVVFCDATMQMQWQEQQKVKQHLQLLLQQLLQLHCFRLTFYMKNKSAETPHFITLKSYIFLKTYNPCRSQKLYPHQLPGAAMVGGGTNGGGGENGGDPGQGCPVTGPQRSKLLAKLNICRTDT